MSRRIMAGLAPLALAMSMLVVQATSQPASAADCTGLQLTAYGSATYDWGHLVTAAGFTASGGTGPYTYTVVDGALPTGVRLVRTTGRLSGVAAGKPGRYDYHVQVTDSAAPACSVTFPQDPYSYHLQIDAGEPLGLVLSTIDDLPSTITWLENETSPGCLQDLIFSIVFNSPPGGC